MLGHFVSQYFSGDPLMYGCLTNWTLLIAYAFQVYFDFSGYTEFTRQEGVNFFNLVPYFDMLRKQIDYPLYPLYGFHWSEYGMLFALDSITHAIESLRHIDLPDLVITGNEWTDLLHYTDKVRMADPFYHYRQENKIRPSLLTIADSY